jgi:hypothetical protein
MIGTNTRRRKVAWCAVRDDARGVCVCVCMYGMLCVRACTRALHVQFAKHMKWNGMEENTHFQTRSAQRQICSRFCLSEPVHYYRCHYCFIYGFFWEKGPSAYLDEDFLETRINDLLVQFVAVERQALHELLHRALRLEREQR